MSYAFTESYIQSKLRRLEEVNQYNKAKLAMFQKKKHYVSRKEYERYKNILFEQDYRVVPKHKTPNTNQENVQEQISQQISATSQKQSKRSNLSSKQSSISVGNVLANSKTHHSQNSSQSHQIEKQQRSKNNSQSQKQQQQQEQIGVNDQQNDNSYNNNNNNNGSIIRNEATNASMNQQQGDVRVSYSQQPVEIQNQTGGFLEVNTYNEEEYLFNQQQMLRNIRLIEMEKKELENQLDTIRQKEQVITKRNHLVRSLDEECEEQHTLSSERFTENPRRQNYSSLSQFTSIGTTSSTLSPRLTSPFRRRASAVTLEGTRDTDKELQKKLGLDFETQWNLLEKWDTLEGSAAPSVKPAVIVQKRQKTFPVVLNVRNSQIQGGNEKGNSWESEFNKIGKTQEERQMMIDDQIIFFEEFVGRNGMKSNSSDRSNIVNKQTIDRLSNDIDFLMKYTQLNLSSKNSPFKNKKSLYEIPEEQYSHDTSVNF